MKIIVDTPAGKKYMIKPTENGLCYQVWTEPKVVKTDKDGNRYGKNGKIIKEDWVFTEKYPATIDGAFRCIAEMMLKDPEDNTEISCNIKDYKEVSKTIATHVKKMTASVMKGE